MSAGARPAVAFVGVGRMGRLMARRVAQAGFPRAARRGLAVEVGVAPPVGATVLSTHG